MLDVTDLRLDEPARWRADDIGVSLPTAAVAASALALAACGGGGGPTATSGGGATGTPSAPVVVVAAAPTLAEASRFLGQATMGAMAASIQSVTASSYAAWLDAQVAMPRALPPKLFSHNDQQSYFQASSPEGATSGWGGRIGDVYQNGNGNASLTCINTSGNAVYLTGRSALQYSIGTGGPISLLSNSTSLFGSATVASTLRSLMTGSNGHLFAAEHAKVSKRALDTYTQVSGALAGAPAANFTLFPTGNNLADQLKMVARMISVSQELGVKRQVFFVSQGGHDLHDNLATAHPTLMTGLGNAMRAFYDTTVGLGVSDRVTTFTGSDFGRTLQSNDDGSDHGWGAMHFVMGGAVKGQRFYGTPPAIGNGTADDVGQGRLLPTTSVDQYAATLAQWFGVPTGELTTVLPNMGNYNPSTWNLGFV